MDDGNSLTVTETETVDQTTVTQSQPKTIHGAEIVPNGVKRGQKQRKQLKIMMGCVRNDNKKDR